MYTVRGGAAVELRGVWVRYAGSGRPALRNITLTVPLGVLVLVTGPNGAGKTTLLETCLGLLKPYRGSVKLLGVDTRSWRITGVRKLCSYVPQDYMRPPHESYTVRQVIEMGLAPYRAPFESQLRTDDVVSEVAKLLGIEDLLDRPVGTLSGGQQQKVFIARALARRPVVLFLDEPFSSLDHDSRYLVAKVVRRYVDERRATAVVVSHDTSPVEDLADVVIELVDGRVVHVEYRW